MYILVSDEFQKIYWWVTSSRKYTGELSAPTSPSSSMVTNSGIRIQSKQRCMEAGAKPNSVCQRGKPLGILSTVYSIW